MDAAATQVGHSADERRKKYLGNDHRCNGLGVEPLQA